MIMIKINLSPKGTRSTSGGSSSGFNSGILDKFLGSGGMDSFSTPDNVKKEAILRLFILCIFPIGLFAYEQLTLPDLEAQLVKKQTLIKELQAFNNKATDAVSEIKKFKEDEKNIQSRIDVLQKIAKSRFKEIQMIDLIQQILPEMAWLEKLQITESKMNFDGFAANDGEISNLMESLNKSVFLSDVNLINSKDTEVDGIKLKKFSIVCTLDHGKGG